MLVVDPMGNMYEPEMDNFMKIYGDKSCRVKFTPLQVQRMRLLIGTHPIMESLLREQEEVLAACGCAEGDVIIAGNNVVISTDQDITGNLIIPTGTHLTVTSKLTFLPGAALYVERGAKLTLHGGTLTSYCTHGFWKGVRVQGNRNKIQPDVNATLDADDAGVVHIKNGGTIQLAEFGVRTYDDRLSWPANADHYGGLIVAEDANFRNNIRAISFMKYEMSNKSNFLNCMFETTSAMPQQKDGYGIINWSAQNIIVENCTFQSLKVGIGGTDYSTVVRGESKFINCELGFGVNATYPFDGMIEILNSDEVYAEFINNAIGLSTRGGIVNAYNTKVLKDNQYTFTTDAIGARILGPANFDLRDNLFDNMNTAISFRNVGNDVGQGRIECNTFLGNDKQERVGILGRGTNTNAWFKYNTFSIDDECQPDVLLLGEGGANSTVVNPFIGEEGDPADNCFSQSDKLEIKTVGNVNKFRYYIPNNGIPCEFPHDNLSDGGVNNYETRQTLREDFNCRYGGEQTGDEYTKADFDEVINLLNNYSGENDDEEYLNLEQRRDITRTHLIREYRENENHAGLVTLLNQDGSVGAQRLLFGYYVSQGNFEMALSTLLGLPSTTAEDIAFRDVQLINLARLQSSGLYHLVPSDYVKLSDIAQSDNPSAYYAQSLLELLTKDEFTEDAVPPCAIPLKEAQIDTLAPSIVIYPNPADQFIYLDLVEPNLVKSIRIMNLEGKIISEYSPGTGMIDISNLTSGLYLLKIILSDGRMMHKRFTKSK